MAEAVLASEEIENLFVLPRQSAAAPRTRRFAKDFGGDGPGQYAMGIASTKSSSSCSGAAAPT
jgi:hypothetical protein